LGIGGVFWILLMCTFMQVAVAEDQDAHEILQV
jgi:hypothetical protein